MKVTGVVCYFCDIEFINQKKLHTHIQKYHYNQFMENPNIHKSYIRKKQKISPYKPRPLNNLELQLRKSTGIEFFNIFKIYVKKCQNNYKHSTDISEVFTRLLQQLDQESPSKEVLVLLKLSVVKWRITQRDQLLYSLDKAIKEIG